MDSIFIWCICNTLLGVLNLLIHAFTQIQHNHCQSSCCRGFCWFDDELDMKETSVPVPNITITPPK